MVRALGSGIPAFIRDRVASLVYHSQVASTLLLAVCAVVFSSQVCFAAPPDKAAKALIAVDNEWSNASVARDVDRVASFYADDAVVYPPNEAMVVGRITAREVWAKMIADPNFQLSWKTVSAGVECKTGWTAGTYEASPKSPDGETAVEKGKYLWVWRKGADGK